MKGLEKSRDQAEGDDVSDAIAAQVMWMWKKI